MIILAGIFFRAKARPDEESKGVRTKRLCPDEGKGRPDEKYSNKNTDYFYSVSCRIMLQDYFSGQGLVRTKTEGRPDETSSSGRRDRGVRTNRVVLTVKTLRGDETLHFQNRVRPQFETLGAKSVSPSISTPKNTKYHLESPL